MIHNDPIQKAVEALYQRYLADTLSQGFSSLEQIVAQEQPSLNTEEQAEVIKKFYELVEGCSK